MSDRRPLFKKAKDIKPFLLLTLFLIPCLMSSCVHAPAPFRPSNWMSSPIDMSSIQDQPDQPLLQVIIVYGPAWCHHSALRLVCPDRPVLFWDPGGSYGLFHQEDIRSRDLILIDPPDLETYLQFTWVFSSVEVEVFEWELTKEQAQEMFEVLIHGTDKNHPAGRFTTPTMGGFCSMALSDFLHRFARKTIIVPKSFFFPHDLAKVLYAQSPRRVLSFRRGKQILYLPPQIPSTEKDFSPVLK